MRVYWSLTAVANYPFSGLCIASRYVVLLRVSNTLYVVPPRHPPPHTVKHRFLPVSSFSKCFTFTLFPPYLHSSKVMLHVCVCS